MQTTMTMESCCRCGQLIAPGKPAMQSACVDIDDRGRVKSSPVKAYHLSGRCREEYWEPRRPAERLFSQHR